MPTIDTPLLLDALLVLVMLLFVPFGVRRGAAKEAMVSAGILFGGMIANTWAERGGAELAARFGVDPRVAPFALALAALFGGLFILGYGGGAALGHVTQGWLSHLVGGILAIVNAGLLLTFVLTFLDRFLDLPAALQAGYIAPALLTRFDWIQLFAAGGLVLLVLLGIVVSVSRQQGQPRPVAVVPARQRPVRLASEPADSKFEPDVPPSSGPRPVPALDQTAPILERPRRPWDEPDRGTNGKPPWTTDGSATRDDMWARPAPPTWAATPPRPASAGAASQPGTEAGSRCPACGAMVGPRDLFCPSCGKTV